MRCLYGAHLPQPAKMAASCENWLGRCYYKPPDQISPQRAISQYGENYHRISLKRILSAPGISTSSAGAKSMSQGKVPSL